MKPAFSLLFFIHGMSPAEHPIFPTSLVIFFFLLFFLAANGITGKETHIYHIMFSSIDWIEDLLAFQVFWTRRSCRDIVLVSLPLGFHIIGINRLDTPLPITSFEQ
jgi:hypothetical protein